MFEKVSPCHPDKVADRIAGALVDLAYAKQENPKIAVEVLLGHGNCVVIAETSVHNTWEEVAKIVSRLTNTNVSDREENTTNLKYVEVAQDSHLANNQAKEVRCGDNGIFKGVPTTEEQVELSLLARHIYATYPFDGKYIINNGNLIICHSNTEEDNLRDICGQQAIINPLGYWTGGSDVDSGATNRKLGSDMADSVTGGGLHGKDLSKADVSVNIWCYVKAQKEHRVIKACCAIGDREVSFYTEDDQFIEKVDYQLIVDYAKYYINKMGGFEKFAEWGLV